MSLKSEGRGAIAGDNVRTDCVARKLAQREFGIPLAVEAGAGTGKTAILTARILVWSLGQGWDSAVQRLKKSTLVSVKGTPGEDKIAAQVLGRVVAITFTEAAAAEMAARVAKGLWDLQQGRIPVGVEADCLPREEVFRKRAEFLLTNLHHLVILTIHAFSLKLLSSFPLEAGLHPILQVDGEGMIIEEMARQVLETHLRRALLDHSGHPFSVLSEHNIDPEQLLEATVQMAQQGVPLEALEEDFFSLPRLCWFRDTLNGTLKEFLDAMGTSLADQRGRSKIASELVSCVETTCKVIEDWDPVSWEALEQLCEVLRGLWKDNLIKRLQQWGSGRFTNTEAKALGSKTDAITQIAACIHGWLRHLFNISPRPFLAARELLSLLLRDLYTEMCSKGVITFGWILRAARDLLRSHPEICSLVRRSIDQVLVDEFQDTDTLQCEIIRLIALEGSRDERPGLFIVGDPKQSIYGWRSADLRAYEGFVEEIVRCGGKVLSLNVNFRSAPPILEEVGRVMEDLMVYKKGVQPRFEPLFPAPKNSQLGFLRGPWSTVEYWVSQGFFQESLDTRGQSKGRATELEARALARDILRLHTEAGVPWSDIGVLFRTTGDLDVYLQALKEEGIPYWVSKAKTYFRRREILDAISLLSAILDPTDQVGLVGYLRSSCAGMPDGAWTGFWKSGLPEMLADEKSSEQTLETLTEMFRHLANNLPQSLPGIERIQGWQWSVAAAIHALVKLRSSFRCDPQDVFVEKIKQLTLIEVAEAAKYLGIFRSANLDRFFRHLCASLESSRGTPHTVLRSLRSSIKRERDAEEALPVQGQGDAVQIMTIHGAKGLDFPHVYVVQVHKSPREGNPLETHVEAADTGWECVLLGWPSIGYLQITRRTNELSRAEAIRTLYVAMTRAKERLVLAGSWESDPRGNTYAHLLRKRKGGFPEVGQILEQREAGAGELAYKEELTGVVWRFPATWDWELNGNRKKELSGLGKDIDEILKGQKELQTLEAWAKVRMMRPWQAPISQKAHIQLETRWGEGRPLGGATYGGRDVALVLGRAFHRVLEQLDVEEDDPLEILARIRPRLVEEVQRFLDQDQIPVAIAKIEGILQALKRGKILSRLREIGKCIIAKELEVLLAPEDECGPVGSWAGSIDLVYTDPASGEIVAVDYKTDKISTPEDIDRLCSIYSSQGAGYAAALQQMLGLEKMPRFELWFLDADEIREIDIWGQGGLKGT